MGHGRRADVSAVIMKDQGGVGTKEFILLLLGELVDRATAHCDGGCNSKPLWKFKQNSYPRAIENIHDRDRDTDRERKREIVWL